MAEHGPASESFVDKINEKIHGHDSSSSSDSEDGKSPTVKTKIFRLFGQEKPVHKVLGGGKPADVFLWRNKKVSGVVLGGATVVWFLFELLEYHLITLVCHTAILALSLLFLWANASTYINRSPPRIPEIVLPEKYVLDFASALRIEINRALAVLRQIPSLQDFKKFLVVIAGLWILSTVGGWCSFITFIYITLIMLHTLPVVYEKYDDQIDSVAEKAMVEIKKQYAVFDEMVISKISKELLKEKKKA